MCNALTGYVRNDSYLKAVIEGQWRHDLNGEQTEEILENERQYSREFLVYREEKRRSRKAQKNSESEKVRDSEDNIRKKSRTLVKIGSPTGFEPVIFTLKG